MDYRKIQYGEMRTVASELIRESRDFLAAITVGGDRITCCEWAIAAYDDAKCVGLATFAPQGEEQSGQPTVVGVYVLPKYRKQGIGLALFQQTCEEAYREATRKVRVDAMSRDGTRLVKKLSQELRAHLDVHVFPTIF